MKIGESIYLLPLAITTTKIIILKSRSFACSQLFKMKNKSLNTNINIYKKCSNWNHPSSFFQHAKTYGRALRLLLWIISFFLKAYSTVGSSSLPSNGIFKLYVNIIHINTYIHIWMYYIVGYIKWESDEKRPNTQQTASTTASSKVCMCVTQFFE